MEIVIEMEQSVNNVNLITWSQGMKLWLKLQRMKKKLTPSSSLKLVKKFFIILLIEVVFLALDFWITNMIRNNVIKTFYVILHIKTLIFFQSKGLR